jgi:tRNA 5-methylaminomethyl-2-thiouridine biosynthesis bifunctional protein
MKNTPVISDPILEWKPEQGPFSGRFNDIYFSTADGLAESRYVFLNGIGAPEVWQGRDRYAIGETGFGTGLNFLAAWQKWRNSASPDAILSYVAIEGFPLTATEIARALEPHPELADLTRQLVDAYPEPHPGYHQIRLDGGRVNLVLLFGEVGEMLSSFTGQMDAWFLDGFAPQKNPDMWTSEVLNEIATLSRKGTRLATFTAAGQVRRDLESAGFQMEKAGGYGRKRECLRGEFINADPSSKLAPWYRMPDPLRLDARVAVIGAGVAGAALANALKTTSAQVTVYDRQPAAAMGASGNPSGLLQPRPADPRQPYARFQTEAYLHSVRMLGRLADEYAVWKGRRGIVSLVRDAAFLDRYVGWLSDGALPDAHAKVLKPEDMKDVCGIDIREPAILFPKGGTIAPVAVCSALLESVDCRFDVKIDALRYKGGSWQLISADGLVLGEADAVVLANGVEARALSPSADLSLHAKRGQISLVKSTERSRKLKVGLSYGGYATPSVDDQGAHILGATYQRCADWDNPQWRELRNEDHQSNLELPAQRSPELAGLFGNEVSGGRASLRTTTADHVPVIGPLFSDLEYEEAYADLRHGKHPSRYPSANTLDGVPGLYILTAFGSRGFALASLAAEVLVAEMYGLPVPLEKSVIEMIHPARFLVRSLKRR